MIIAGWCRRAAAVGMAIGLVACSSGPSKPAPAPATRPTASPANRAGAQATSAAARTAIAIVAHPQTDVGDLTFAKLRRIFLGEQQFWNDRSKVTLLIRAPTTRERSVVLDKIYRMNEDQFRQYWIGKMFRAEVAGEPKMVYSTDMALTLVRTIKGSITFVPASAVTSDVKVVRIDGKLPSDPDYPLR
jgi:ABC-type phosphate transport system substrate-binding protein